jgi:hypothetical protein
MRGCAAARSRQYLSCRMFFNGRDPGDAIASAFSFVIFHPVNVLSGQFGVARRPISEYRLNLIVLQIFIIFCLPFKPDVSSSQHFSF